MKHHAARLASGFLSVFAVLFVTPYCAMFLHKPEVPAELLNKKS